MQPTCILCGNGTAPPWYCADLYCAFIILTVLLGIALLPMQASAQWAAEPGDTVRNGFGPVSNLRPSVCRGACGMDCPSSCEQGVQFECAGGGKLLRIRSYSCGTHQGCREHDDCLDRCVQEHAPGYDCAAECHAQAVSDWGLERAGPWAAGAGPYEGDPISFEYTRDTPDGPDAFYRCPRGAQLQCAQGLGRCLAGEQSVEPVFDTFAGGATGAVTVTGFRSGRVCVEGGQPSSVCQPSVDIQVTGEESCAQAGGEQPCTWYGFELDYRNADPVEPLICQTSAADGDFLGGVMAKVIESAPPRDKSEPESELGKLFGHFQKELNSGKSLDQVFSGISITTADGKTLGGAPADTFPAPGVPGEVALSGPSGHLLVPIFELQNASPPGSTVEHQVRCLQSGQPVIETTFRLHFSGG